MFNVQSSRFNVGRSFLLPREPEAEERPSLVTKAQPEADPPLAEMGFYLEEACKLD
jgi:hypothetical protein